jgi:hypothetical protein
MTGIRRIMKSIKTKEGKNPSMKPLTVEFKLKNKKPRPGIELRVLRLHRLETKLEKLIIGNSLLRTLRG